MIQYNKSTIYKLCCKDANIIEIYVGSTTNFRLRKSQHKNICNNENSKNYNMKKYKFIRENGGFENWDMVEIEKVNATDKKDLHKNERRVIEELKPVLNSSIPGRTHKEYYADNIDKIKEYSAKNADKIKEYRKEYSAKNANKIKEYCKEYSAKNADKIKEYCKEYKKEYSAKNADKIKEKMNVYYSENVDKIKEKNKEKIECKCGSKITKSSLSRHSKSKKHIQYIKNIIPDSNLIFV